MAPRVLLLARGLGEVSCRFRLLQYVPHLRARGIEVDVADVRAPLPRRLRTLRACAAYDAVCVHRLLLSAPEASLLRRAAQRYVFDFDDAILFRDSNHARTASWSRRRRFRRMVRLADVVVAGNAYLAECARRYSDRVRVIPTTVDLREAPPPEREPQPRPVVGWMGSASNLGYVRLVLPALRRLRRLRPDVELRLVCDGVLGVCDPLLVELPWSRARERDDLAAFQIGIMPLADDPWTRGKCGAKVLQYFAASLPVVCSPVGSSRELVVHGDNGYLAAGEEEWLACLDDLLGDAEKRRRFGARGRRLVEEQYSAEARVEELAEALLGK
jgi:glycosyltransferase involved in cell wall biosynthesis